MIAPMPYPFIQAKHYYPGRTKTPRLFVVHTAETPETSTSAEGLAKYFSTTDTKVSAHLVGDSDSVVQCVKYQDTAFAAPGANSDGIQYELSGKAAQTTQWNDEHSKKAIHLMALAARSVCGQFGLPLKHLTNAELAAGEKGIVGHVQVSQVYKKSSHYDPGANFPWNEFISLAAGTPQPQEEPMARAVKGHREATVYIIEGTGVALEFADPATYNEVARAYGIKAVETIDQDAFDLLKKAIGTKFVA